MTTIMIGADGLIADSTTRERITGTLATLAGNDEGRDFTEATGIS